MGCFVDRSLRSHAPRNGHNGQKVLVFLMEVYCYQAVLGIVAEEAEQVRTKRHVVGAALSEYSGMDVRAKGSSGIIALPVDVALFSQELSGDAGGNESGLNAG